MPKIRMIAIATLAAAPMVSAQQPNASAAAYGMAGNYQAAATGFNAVAWNPAMLGMGSGGFTLNLLSGGVVTGLGPVRVNDITAFSGKTIPAATKEAWLNQIGTGTETGGANAGISFLALSIGQFAFQAGVSGTGDANLNQDAAEAILYGNAGRTGTAKNLSFNGSSLYGATFATGAASVAIPLPLTVMGPLDRISMGLTVKYVQGLTVASAQDGGSTVTANNVAVSFPAIFTDSTHMGNSGSGVGVDLGLAWNSGASPERSSTRSMRLRFDDDATASAKRPARRRTVSTAPGSSGR